MAKPLVYIKRIQYEDPRYISHKRDYFAITAKITLEVIGDRDDVNKYLDFVKTKLPVIIKSHELDWHVKEDPERIEFILDIMAQVQELFIEGKVAQAEGLFKLIETVLPTYQNDKRYPVVEEMRNILWDELMRRKAE